MFGLVISSTGARWLHRVIADVRCYVNVDSDAPRAVVYSAREI